MKTKTVTVLLVVFLCLGPFIVEADTTVISGKLKEYSDEIKRVVDWAIGVVFFVGVIHVVASKNDEDKGKMKRLMMAYGAAFLFALIGKALAETLLPR